MDSTYDEAYEGSAFTDIFNTIPGRREFQHVFRPYKQNYCESMMHITCQLITFWSHTMDACSILFLSYETRFGSYYIENFQMGEKYNVWIGNRTQGLRSHSPVLYHCTTGLYNSDRSLVDMYSMTAQLQINSIFCRSRCCHCMPICALNLPCWPLLPSPICTDLSMHMW